MAKEIEPKLQTIGVYLKKTDIFTIPEYQRAYSWTTSHCDKLWLDVENYISQNAEDPYFFGTIIIDNMNLDDLWVDAKKEKKDEFYTRLECIEDELSHYKKHFKNKVICLPCDESPETKFFEHFATKMDDYCWKKVIAIGYKEDESVLVHTLENTGEDEPEYSCNTISNGDFRNLASQKLIEESDIIVTNPPFSLFREFIDMLTTMDKKFIVLGNNYAIGYKEIFPLIMHNQLWLGYGFKGNAGHFINEHYDDYATASDHKEGMIRVSGVTWFTNLEIPKRNEELVLYRKYNPDEYPKYDNYDAIEVSKTVDIPEDYDGVMGVPITFMDKYCPEQFEILGMCENEDLYGLKTRVYNRTECQNAYSAKFGKKGSYDLNASGVLTLGGIQEKVYQRILIRKRQSCKSC